MTTLIPSLRSSLAGEGFGKANDVRDASETKTCV